MTPVILVDDLAYHHPDGTPALRGVGLRVLPGERVALLGANGAGKTTLALHLNGILRPDRGRVSVGGVEVSDRTASQIRPRVGLVFQDADAQLFCATVADDVAFGPANMGLARDQIEQRVETALARTGAGHLRDRNPHRLSTGEKRRVALATVLAMDPSILVLDEPSAGLDPAGRRELAELLAGLGQALLLITHDLLLALQLCPRSVILHQGRVGADGSTAGLLADPELLAANRLELPVGVDPALLAGPGDGAAGTIRDRP